MAAHDIFDFIITEDNNVILMIYARETAPYEPSAQLLPEEGKIVIQRNQDEILNLSPVEQDVFNALKQTKKLLVCEIKSTKKANEKEISFVYHIEI